MKRKILSIGAVVFLTSVTSVWAVDLFGNWIVKIWETQEPSEIVFCFKEDGERLKGTVSDSQGEAAISEGKINGDEISFVVVRRSGGKRLELLYKGKVDLNEIKFTVEVKGVAAPTREFIASREFLRHNDYVPRPIVAPVPRPKN